MRKSELRAGGSIIGLTLVFVLTALLAACGGSDDVTVGELNTQEPTAAGQPVMSTAPLSQLPGSPFIADDTALWYTDFSSIARFDIAARRWTTFKIPAKPGTVDGMSLQLTGTGGVVGVATICDAECDRSTPRHLAVLVIEKKLSLRDVDNRESVSSDSFVAPVGRSGTEVTFRVPDGSRTHMVTVDRDGSINSTIIDEPIAALCATADGYVGAADDPSTGSPLAPRTVVAGKSATDLKAVGVSGDAQALLDSPDGTAVCAGQGLSVVGPGRAYDISVDGSATPVASDVGRPLQRELELGNAVDREGTLWMAATAVNLRRSASGWTAAGTDSGAVTGYATVDGELLRYPSDSKPAAPEPLPTSAPAPKQGP